MANGGWLGRNASLPSKRIRRVLQNFDRDGFTQQTRSRQHTCATQKQVSTTGLPVWCEWPLTGGFWSLPNNFSRAFSSLRRWRGTCGPSSHALHVKWRTVADTRKYFDACISCCHFCQVRPPNGCHFPWAWLVTAGEQQRPGPGRSTLPGTHINGRVLGIPMMRTPLPPRLADKRGVQDGWERSISATKKDRWIQSVAARMACLQGVLPHHTRVVPTTSHPRCR